MNTIISGSELLRKAAAFVLEEKSLGNTKSIADLVDEAAMRFNLSPLESASLCRIMETKDCTTHKQDKNN